MLQSRTGPGPVLCHHDVQTAYHLAQPTAATERRGINQPSVHFNTKVEV